MLKRIPIPPPTAGFRFVRAPQGCVFIVFFNESE